MITKGDYLLLKNALYIYYMYMKKIQMEKKKD